MKKEKAEKVITAIVFLFALFMMVHKITYSTLWGDEWIEWLYSQKSFRTGDWYQAVSSTLQPPLYNVVMHFWLKISDTIFWFRFANVIMGMAASIFLYLSLKKLYKNVYISCMAVVGLCACYQWIYYVQECAEYCLMMTCLFAALYYYICAVSEPTHIYRNELSFILLSVSAVYTQYGAVFIVVPLLVVYYLHAISSKNKDSIFRITVYYLICMIIFAVPLYVFFLKGMMGKKDLSHSMRVTFDPGILKTNIRELLLYLYNIKRSELNITIFAVIAILFIMLAAAVLLILAAKKDFIKSSLLLTFVSAYCIHSAAVLYDIYSTNYIKGMACRYSLFYIPIMSIVIPVILVEIVNVIPSRKIRVGGGTTVLLCFTWIVIASIPSIMQNWKKAYDDEFAEIWIENGGYNSITYVCGYPGLGYTHYLTSAGYDTESVTGHLNFEINNETVFPDDFWLWKTGWSYEKFDQILEEISQKPEYKIIIYADHGNKGQLAYCYKWNGM